MNFKVVRHFEYRGALGVVRKVSTQWFPDTHNGYVLFRENVEHPEGPVGHDYSSWDELFGLSVPNGGWTFCEGQDDVLILGFDGLHSWNEKNPVTLGNAEEMIREATDNLHKWNRLIPIDGQVPEALRNQLGWSESIGIGE